MNIVIIGCGLIGRKRALALDHDDRLLACCDTNRVIGKKFADDFFCQFFADYQELLEQIECEAVIVAVVNKFAADMIIDALKLSKSILAEKPLGRNADESDQILISLEKEQSRNSMGKLPILKTGFNHRFHPGIWQAKEMVSNGKIGEIFSIRARYGHGGRPGMEKEWRASKDLCGGGELLDQGVHVIDLIRWFGGEITEVFGKAETKFWDMEVEDNAFAILKTDRDVTASFHVSWTNWKNIFSFEIFGTRGYIKIEGLGGSYEPETLEIGIRKEEGGRPDITLQEFPSEDVSWKNEWAEFKKAVREKREPLGNGYDGHQANLVIDAIYRSSEQNQVIFLNKP